MGDLWNNYSQRPAQPYALVQLLFLTLELLEVHVAPRGSDHLKLTAIDGHQVTSDQACHAAKLNKGATRRQKGEFVALRKSAMVLKSGLSRLISHIIRCCAGIRLRAAAMSGSAENSRRGRVLADR